MVKAYTNVSLRFVNCAETLADFSLENWNHTTRLTYARFLIPTICKYSDKAIWMDSDIVVKRDPFNLYIEDVEEYYLAAARDIRAVGELNDPNDPQMDNFTKKLKLKNPYDYFQAGVMLLNIKKIAEDFSLEKLLKEAQRKDLRWLDQDVLNLLCQGHIKYISQKWNYVVRAHIPIEDYAPAEIKKEWDLAKKNPWIIHYAGRRQPVYVKDVEFFDEFWKYARESPFYESLIVEMATADLNKYLIEEQKRPSWKLMMKIRVLAKRRIVRHLKAPFYLALKIRRFILFPEQR
jgi:lipopolysaccharide biosynthesis glycosyltransferase